MSEKEVIKLTDGKAAEASQRRLADKSSQDGRSDRHAGIMNLQRSAGNRAVASLLQNNMSPASSNDNMTVGAPDDSYESEADRVADEVLQGAGSPCPESAANNPAQDGQHLSPAARRFWESRFGYDFSDVKVHAGKTAEDAANSLDADAYTVGSNIVLGPGQDAQDARLMAHELTHVIQQGGAQSTGSGVSVPVSQMPSNSGGAQAQRQTKGQAKKSGVAQYSISPSQIKKFINDKNNPEVSRLVEGNQFNGRPSEVKLPNAPPDAPKWRLKIDLMYKGGGTAGDTHEEEDKTQLPANTRQINININPFRVEPNPEYEKAIPNVSERGHTLLAQTVYHELVHALIIIENAMPVGAKHSATYNRFKKQLAVANSASFSLLKSAVTDKLEELVAMARGGSKQTDEQATVNKMLEYLINEKFAHQAADVAFRPRGADKPKESLNRKVAKSYSKTVGEKILSWSREKGLRPPANLDNWKTPWDKKVASLVEPVYELFKEIDSQQAHPLDELMPQPTFGAKALRDDPEPAELEGLKRKKQ